MQKNPIMLVGCLSTDLLSERRRRSHRMEEAAGLAPLLDLKLVSGRLHRKKRCGVWMWWQRREGTIMGAMTGCALLQEANDATSCSLKVPHFDADHRLVKAGLKTQLVKGRARHVKKRAVFPATLAPLMLTKEARPWES